MTATLRPLFGVVFAALIALSLVASAADALASTAERSGGPTLFDQGFVDRSGGLFKPRPIGRLGVTWE
ncbi:MAG TPA: hypothetical protein VFC31_00505 [Candidatus Limnocylindria bacterium]|nr:hypothetical protein [Candidatus Limnocylindria bacterium]